VETNTNGVVLYNKSWFTTYQYGKQIAFIVDNDDLYIETVSTFLEWRQIILAFSGNIDWSICKLCNTAGLHLINKLLVGGIMSGCNSVWYRIFRGVQKVLLHASFFFYNATNAELDSCCTGLLLEYQ
jgi:hypothetical protein